MYNKKQMIYISRDKCQVLQIHGPAYQLDFWLLNRESMTSEKAAI